MILEISMFLAQTGGDMMHWSDATWLMFFCVGIPIGGGIICGIVSVIAKEWRKARVAEAEARLKETMIAQGRPTDEIERVINASAFAKSKKTADE